MHLQGFDRLPCLCRQTASSPGEAGLGPLAAQSLTGAFRLRSCPRGFEPVHTQKTKQDGKIRLVLFGASSGVRPSALLAPADCVLARRSRPRTTRCSKPHRGFSLTLVPSRVRTLAYTKKQNKTERSVSFSLVHLQGFEPWTP